MIFDGTVDGGSTLSSAQLTACDTCIASIEIPDDRSVHPGTDRIAVELDWEDPQTAPSVEVRLRWDPPVGEDGSEARTEPGNITVPVSSNQTDVPFANATEWSFDVDAFADPAGSHPDLEIDVTMTIVRDGPVPEIPVPRDPWDGTDEIALVDEVPRTTTLAARAPGIWFYQGASSGCICSDGFGFTWPVEEGSLVPAGAERVRAVLTWDWSSPAKPSLYRSVDGDAQPMEVVEDGDGRRVFEADVPDDLVDSVFRRRSDWSFYASLETQGQDVGAVSGSMTLTATAQRNATASSTY